MIQFHEHIFQMGWNHQPEWELSIYIYLPMISWKTCPWEWYIFLCHKNPCDDCAFSFMKTKHEQIRSFMYIYIQEKTRVPHFMQRDTVFVTT